MIETIRVNGIKCMNKVVGIVAIWVRMTLSAK